MKKRALTDSAAELSECGLYRYFLMREWSAALKLRFLMLNPSVADWKNDDPTIRKCMGFAEALGFGGIIVMNLFAFRATYPIDLVDAIDPVGPENDHWTRALTTNEAPIVCAWGSSGNTAVRRLVQARLPVVQALLGKHPLACLGRSQDGQPRHPLMLSYSTQLEPWFF